MKGAIAVVKRAFTANTVAAIEAEIAACRGEAEVRRGEANECRRVWLFATSQSEAEKIAGRRTEALRLVQRAEAELPHLEAQLAAAKAERQRKALGRHRSAIAALYPKLRRAIEEALRVQAEAIAAREAAIAELGEHTVGYNIPALAFRGILLPDLVQLWVDEQDRVWAAPRAIQPATNGDARRQGPAKAAGKAIVSASRSEAAPIVANGHAGPDAATPQPRPRRQPRRPGPPAAGELQVQLLRPGVEMPDGSQTITGDRANVPAETAKALVERGAADFVSEESHQ